jgi:hypothetical protein
MTPNLSNWYGGGLQGYTDYSNNIQMQANLYGDGSKQVDPLMASEFIQTLAHELLHVQQSSLEKLLTHGELHEQIDRNAELIAKRVADKFKQRTGKAGECGCLK